MSGARDYSVGTRHALFALAQGSCYFPECDVPVVVSVAGFQTTNVQIAHIRGAHPGSARYDPSMTDTERASFDNLLLLCKPHHDLVDKLAARDWPVDALLELKAAREASGATSALRGQVFHGDELEDMLRAVIKDVTVRAVRVDLTAAMDTTQGWLGMPFEAIDTVRDVNPHLGNTTRALAATITNIGGVDSFVSDIGIYLRPDGERGDVAQFTLLGRNDFPQLNPDLPKQLRVGESVYWLTRVSTVRGIAATGDAHGISFSTVWAQARLATGESVESDDVAITMLPRD